MLVQVRSSVCEYPGFTVQFTGGAIFAPASTLGIFMKYQVVMFIHFCLRLLFCSTNLYVCLCASTMLFYYYSPVINLQICPLSLSCNEDFVRKY